MKYTNIMATGSYLPEKVLTNADLEKLVDTSHEWIVERTGICERRIVSPQEDTVTMAVIAGRRAMEAAGVEPKDIGLIVVGTCSPRNFFPSTACEVQSALGIGDCCAFDVMAACAGFVYGVGIIDRFMRAGENRCALLIGSDAMSKIIDWKDRSTCVLFGDGAGAMLFNTQDKPGIMSSYLHAAGEYKNLLYAPTGLGYIPETAYTKMQGRELFKVVIKHMVKQLDETLHAHNISSEAVDWFVPHQANLRIIEAMAKKLRIPMERVIVTLDKQGNTSAASVPLAFDVAVRDGRIKRGDRVLLQGFGGGLVWGTALVQY